MASHVDIIRNEPLAGSSFVLAKVTLNGSQKVEVETRAGGGDSIDQDAMWLYLRSRVHADPESEPEAFLNALPQAIDSTYVVASRVHDDDECPYVHEAPPLNS